MQSRLIFLLILSICHGLSVSMRPSFGDYEEDDPAEEMKASDTKNDLLDDPTEMKSSDYEYNNVDSEDGKHETEGMKEYKKRETRAVEDMKALSDADIELALAKLSDEELHILERLMENESQSTKVEKREISEKRRSCSKYGSKDKDLHEVRNYKKVPMYEELPEETAQKEQRVVKRYNRFGPLTREEILQARIDFLKDNYKRQSERKIENSFKPKERFKRELLNTSVRNPYFNSLIGPRSRTKRSLEKKFNVTATDEATSTVNPMDNPKSDEHIKLLEDSFPNPSSLNLLDSDQSHVRVKRS